LSFIELDSFYDVKIENIEVNPAQKKISIYFNPYSSTNETQLSALLTLKIPKDLIGDISSVSAIYNQVEKQLAFNVSKDKDSFNLIIPNTFSDSKPPTINITNKGYPLPYSIPSIPTITVIANGTAFDTDSGIQKVEAFAHTIPFDNQFPFKLAAPISPGNWSKWSIPLNITSHEDYRILVQATDNAGNKNWDELTVNIPQILLNSR
jgi:hypothetical protein